MPPPSPQGAPPPKRSSLPFLILALLVGVGILGYSRGWFKFDTDKFKQDRDAFTQKVKSAVASGKEKVTGLQKKLTNAKEEEKPAVQKEIDEANKAIGDLEASGRAAETLEDEKKLVELQERVNRLLEESKAKPPKKE